jgi:hypothetical protein
MEALMDDDRFGAAPDLLAKAIEPGERLLWWDMPQQGVRLRPADALMVPFSLMWAGFAFYWEGLALRDGTPVFARLWGIPFVLVGIYVVIGRFFHDAWRRRRIVYGLTTQRVIIASPGETRTLDLAGLGEISLREAMNGTGSVVFGPEPNMFARRDIGPWSGKPAVPTFEGIKDARRVFSTLRTAQQQARGRS